MSFGATFKKTAAFYVTRRRLKHKLQTALRARDVSVDAGDAAMAARHERKAISCAKGIVRRDWQRAVQKTLGRMSGDGSREIKIGLPAEDVGQAWLNAYGKVVSSIAGRLPGNVTMPFEVFGGIHFPGAYTERVSFFGGSIVARLGRLARS